MIVNSQEVGQGNRDCPWDEFNPVEYFKVNYVELRDDDRQIVEIVRDFLVRELACVPLPAGARGIDVGTGANLYPPLVMLPFCEHLTLYEHSEANLCWLRDQMATGWPSWGEAWGPFWDLLRKRSPYADLADPIARLTDDRRVTVVKGDVFSPVSQTGFDIGTMFFVAESITGKRHEFRGTMECFFSMLKPGAPFAMAFMEHSQGYRVGAQEFPATDIDEEDVRECLRGRAHDFSVYRISATGKPLRDHHVGMIVAHGRSGKTCPNSREDRS